MSTEGRTGGIAKQENKDQDMPIIIILLLLVMTSCGSVTMPDGAENRGVEIYPDYRGVTVPRCIAPLNMMVTEDGAKAICATLEAGKKKIIVGARGDRKIEIDEGDWRGLMTDSMVEKIGVTVYYTIENVDYCDTLSIYVSDDEFDPYVTYRLIEPGYEVWNAIQIEERDMRTFKTKILADNSKLGGQCMNCHIHGAEGRVSLFHLRGKSGGTILAQNGTLRKVTLRSDEMKSGAVYGDISSSGRYGVFSTNEIIPALHSVGSGRLEVYDAESDLCIADFERDSMILSPLVSGTEELETFPCFSADGRAVYYCSARAVLLPDSIEALRYSILKIGFDGESWGEKADTVWSAWRNGGSASLLKASPDGRYLMFAWSDHGTFPIWHRETDLRMIDLGSGKEVDVRALNSDVSETYHSWASSSRWVVFASKRNDGQYGRVYVAHIDVDGRAGKPFVLPQSDPESDIMCLKSYNIPDVSPLPADFNSRTVEKMYKEVTAEQFR